MNDTTKNFADFGLSAALNKGIQDLGFENPTPIQAEAIPVLLEGHDVIGRARTGSGKTAAFGLPLLNRVDDNKAVRGLVLAPTRELAVQVGRALEELSKHVRVTILPIYGGASYRNQLSGLKRGAGIVVGTPGRVIDLMERGALDVSTVEYFVLDEADEMLRMGFIEDVERVLSNLPAERQVALFSATMPNRIQKIAKTYLRKPVQIQVEDSALSVDHIDQTFVRVKSRAKTDALLRFIAAHGATGTLVFARTRARCAETAATLIQNGISADALHGDMNQQARERVLSRLRAGSLDVVVATDVAARGLDVEHLSHVINFDMPDSAETYVHRIGRTGRAGRAGNAITLVEPREWRKSRQFANELKIKFQEIKVPSDAEVDRARRKGILDRLDAAIESPATEKVGAWLAEAAKEREWSMHQIASAAMVLLGKELNFDLEPQPAANTPVFYDNINEVEVVVTAGRRDGLRPADIVGTFANDLGVPSNQIGRISLGSHRAYVGLPAKIAELLLTEHPFIHVRGNDVKIVPNNKGGDEEASATHPKKHFRHSRKPLSKGDRRGGKGQKPSGKKPHRKGPSKKK